MPAKTPNRLIDETSPYLKQHAYNPVDWHPWASQPSNWQSVWIGPSSSVSVYSACHWCHVMEHESFEDPSIGDYLKEHFVSIKVDREERPDLDQIYMAATQILTRRGGWPMSVFLTPSLKPFYAGTYFPPVDRYQMLLFRRVLEAIANAWENQRDEIEEKSTELVGHVQSSLNRDAETGPLGPELLANAGQFLAKAFEPNFGGFGHAPKFPHPMDLRLLLRIWNRFGDEHALKMVHKTLDEMARGGIYDHLQGAFTDTAPMNVGLEPRSRKNAL